MLIGIPGSGKSTISERYRQRGHRIHTSDAIRAELYGDEEVQGKATEVFSVLMRRVRSDLKAGHSCVIDATNLRRKRRMQMVRELSGMVDRRTCVMALTSPQVCLERNRLRQRKVPPEVIHGMLCSFEAPWYYEGWDAIEAVCSGTPYVFPREEACLFPQDNPHHRLTLGEHLDAVRDYCREQGWSSVLQEAGWYHDIGKLVTKRFENKRGMPTETAHFYDHENAGTYLYLCEKAPAALLNGSWEDTLYIANLINWHMRILHAWNTSPSAEEKDRNLIGERLYEDLKRLHEADIAGH